MRSCTHPPHRGSSLPPRHGEIYKGKFIQRCYGAAQIDSLPSRQAGAVAQAPGGRSQFPPIRRGERERQCKKYPHLGSHCCRRIPLLNRRDGPRPKGQADATEEAEAPSEKWPRKGEEEAASQCGHLPTKRIMPHRASQAGTRTLVYSGRGGRRGVTSWREINYVQLRL